MAPPSLSNSSIVPIVVAAGSAAIATIWMYNNKKTNKSSEVLLSSAKNIDDVASKEDDDIIHREIDISTTQTNNEKDITSHERILSPGTITIAYASTTNTCANFAKKIQGDLLYHLMAQTTKSIYDVHKVQLVQVSELDWWDELVNNEADDEDGTNKVASTTNGKDGPPILLFILPTWTSGTLPPNSQHLLTSLKEISTDWRVPPTPLRSSHPSTQLKVAAFGMGSSAYDTSTVGKPAKDVFALIVGKLGAKPLVSKNVGNVGGNRSGKKSKSLMIGDDEVGDASLIFDKWMDAVAASIFGNALDGGSGSKGSAISGKKVKSKSRLGKQKKEETSTCGDGNDEGCACKSEGNDKEASAVGCCSEEKGADTGDGGCCSSNNNTNDKKSDDNSMTDSLSDEDDDDESEGSAQDIIDLEDMGDVMKSQTNAMKSKEPQEMVTPKQAKALKKEGYKLIGTHSAVKLCRWTKHQLRGRGGCYKHTHYGITSYQCMEATPSLACANKCVFCWRHHKNPVGREWRWKTDDPKMIVEEAVNMHVDMIKETRGIPGIQMDRWQSAHKVRHCALSLVGEPIMYPQINELLGELHERKISTFLVTNGQHPKAIKDLIPITQLYVSVDASTPESLEAVDRPLFKDAWDRLKTSLSCLKRKGQRTVARLTVVKGWNFDEIGGYARLIALGHCSLVEVKGVTFCGKSDASNLNMSNTPWHHEVVQFTKQLKKELDAIRAEGGDDPLPEYDLACEHKHSCSVLLARVDQFAVPDPEDPSKRKWKTWIDYDKFQVLFAKHKADPTFTFGVEDYIADTPDWAVFGSSEEGFDPTDNRHRKKKKHPKYTKFDDDGIPTHDTFNEALPIEEIAKLKKIMDEKKSQIGEATTVTELHGGEKIIDDASLMFRGLVVSR